MLAARCVSSLLLLLVAAVAACCVLSSGAACIAVVAAVAGAAVVAGVFDAMGFAFERLQQDVYRRWGCSWCAGVWASAG